MISPQTYFQTIVQGKVRLVIITISSLHTNLSKLGHHVQVRGRLWVERDLPTPAPYWNIIVHCDSTSSMRYGGAFGRPWKTPLWLT